MCQGKVSALNYQILHKNPIKKGEVKGKVVSRLSGGGLMPLCKGAPVNRITDVGAHLPVTGLMSLEVV